MNDINRIISELEHQRTAIDRAIAALRDVGSSAGSSASAAAGAKAPATVKRRRRLSPEGRQRIIEATKKRWAAKRAEAQEKPATARKSSAGRKKQAAKKSEA